MIHALTPRGEFKIKYNKLLVLDGDAEYLQALFDMATSSPLKVWEGPTDYAIYARMNGDEAGWKIIASSSPRQADDFENSQDPAQQFGRAAILPPRRASLVQA